MLSVRAVEGDLLLLEGLDRAIAMCLRQVPAILARRESGSSRERFHPHAIPSDTGRNAEWHRLMDDDLRHLFEAAADTFAGDLKELDLRREEIRFPAAHLKAWMNAINQARVVLSEEHGFEAVDMQSDDFSAGSQRDAALLYVQLLGYVLQVLVEFAMGPA